MRLTLRQKMLFWLVITTISAVVTWFIGKPPTAWDRFGSEMWDALWVLVGLHVAEEALNIK